MLFRSPSGFVYICFAVDGDIDFIIFAREKYHRRIAVVENPVLFHIIYVAEYIESFYTRCACSAERFFYVESISLSVSFLLQDYLFQEVYGHNVTKICIMFIIRRCWLCLIYTTAVFEGVVILHIKRYDNKD